MSFYHKKARKRAKYVSVLHCTIPVWLAFCWRKTKQKQCSVIINLLFDVLVDNTRRHFNHYSHFSSPVRGSEKYHATRKISARIIHQKIEYGVFIYLTATTSVIPNNSIKNLWLRIHSKEIRLLANQQSEVESHGFLTYSRPFSSGVIWRVIFANEVISKPCKLTPIDILDHGSWRGGVTGYESSVFLIEYHEQRLPIGIGLRG